MYNFVIFINDFNLIKKFGSIIFNNFKEMNLVGIVSNHKELEHIQKKNTVNLIILSEEKYNSKPIQSLITNIDSTIIITDNTSYFNKETNELFLSKNDTESNILAKLYNFNSLINNQNIKNKVIHILERLKFDFTLLGTTYLIESIIYSYLTKEYYKFENLEKNIYPLVSQKYNIKVLNIKWSITRSINKTKKIIKPEHFEKLNMQYPDKFTAKHFITEIINYI